MNQNQSFEIAMIVLLAIALLAVILFVIKRILQRRAERRMQEQVKSLIFEYMPMDGFEMENFSLDTSTLNETLI
jgi:ABC-type bacteriocin/lantibiotic exporter with double-glycine peptidase domain